MATFQKTTRILMNFLNNVVYNIPLFYVGARTHVAREIGADDTFEGVSREDMCEKSYG
jgi:hypothetical protein